MRYDPAAIAMSQVAEELRALRRYLSRPPATQAAAAARTGASLGRTNVLALATSDAERKMLRYLQGVDSDWVPLPTLAQYSSLPISEAGAFLNSLSARGLIRRKSKNETDIYMIP